MNIPGDISERARAIRLALFDVDGVLTDGNLYIDAKGAELQVFNTQDGHGISMLLHYGIEVGVVTGRSSKALEHRMRDLQVKHVYQARIDKLNTFRELLSKLNLDERQVAFTGDDIVDLQVMSRCGLAVAVANAHALVKRHAHWETSAKGGHGAVREVCDLLLDAQGLLGKAMSHHLR